MIEAIIAAAATLTATTTAEVRQARRAIEAACWANVPSAEAEAWQSIEGDGGEPSPRRYPAAGRAARRTRQAVRDLASALLASPAYAPLVAAHGQTCRALLADWWEAPADLAGRLAPPAPPAPETGAEPAPVADPAIVARHVRATLEGAGCDMSQPVYVEAQIWASTDAESYDQRGGGGMTAGGLGYQLLNAAMAAPWPALSRAIRAVQAALAAWDSEDADALAAAVALWPVGHAPAGLHENARLARESADRQAAMERTQRIDRAVEARDDIRALVAASGAAHDQLWAATVAKRDAWGTPNYPAATAAYDAAYAAYQEASEALRCARLAAYDEESAK